MIQDNKDNIIADYLAGMTGVELGKKYGYHNSTVSKWLHKWGVSRGRKSVKRDKIEHSVVNDFKTNNFYCEDLAKKYDVDVHTIYSILDEYNLPREHTGIKSKCNEDYFMTIDNPNKAYLLGFITADGTIANGRLSIEIHEKDAELLTFFAEEINPDVKISNINCVTSTVSNTNHKKYITQKHNRRIAFGSKKLGESLAKYGIVQNKSKTITRVPCELIPSDLLPFYFRGLIDGDGCIHKNGGVSIYSGSLPFIQNVQSILINELSLSQLKIYHGTSYFITWTSKTDRQKLYNYLYKDLNDTYYLPRKYVRLKNSLNK